MTRTSSRALCASAIALLWLSASGVAATAGDFGIREEAFDDPNYDFKIDTELTAGRLSGTSHEFVYAPNLGGHKNSELIWSMDDVVIIGGKVAIRPSHWWSVEMGGYINGTHEATIDDYDWLDLNTSDWTHWSHHEDTSLERALGVDLSTKLALWRTDFFDLQGIAGYRWDKFDWSAYGGRYVYSSATGFRDDTGIFKPGEIVGSYKQEYSAPYIGLGGELRLGDFTLNGNVTASWWASMHSVDDHWLRHLEFQSTYDGGNMLHYEVEGRYQFTDNMALKAGWQHQAYDEMKGSVRASIAPGGPGVDYWAGDSSGADNSSDIISAGLVYTFR